MKLLCSRMSSENSCSQGFSNAPCEGRGIQQVLCERQLGKPELLGESSQGFSRVDGKIGGMDASNV